MATMTWSGVSRSILGLGLATLLSAATGAASAADTPDAASWVSSDAVVYLELPRPAALLDRLRDEKLHKPLMAIPNIRAVLEKDELKHLDMVSKVVAGKLGIDRDRAIRDLTAGGAIFAVEAAQGDSPGVLLIVTPGDPALLEKANEALIDLARKDAESKGNPDPVKSVEYRGFRGYHAGPKGAWAIVKGRLVIVDRGDTGKKLIDRVLDGPGDKPPVSDLAAWRSRKGLVKDDTNAFGFARLERLRELDPKSFGKGDEKSKPPEVIFFGGWIDAIRQAPWASAALDWTDSKLALAANVAVKSGGRPAATKGFIPPPGGPGAPALLSVPGAIASLSLYRDLAAVWEARADLLPPQEVQNLAKLDTFAGQFFGGRDFGTGVLGAVTSDWRLVAAMQDHSKLDPVPDVKLPAFGLVLDVKPGDDDFSERLKVAFQSFIGLANLGAAQSKAPPLELGSENCEGFTISTARFMLPKKNADDAKASRDGGDVKQAVHYRHNFSPSAVQVGQKFVISSSVGLAKDLIKAIKEPGKPNEATLVTRAEGSMLAKLVDLNRERLVMQNMLEKGHDKDQAEGEVDLLAALLRYLGQGRLSIQDAPESTRVNLEFATGK